jgi:pimeloyl-ACP methyl ester carboxylesterase
LAGCQGYLFDPADTARDLARGAGLSETRIAAAPFQLMGFYRIDPEPGRSLHVYIEGDGQAWRTRTQPPSDPSPTDPMGLRLARGDSAANLLYLARPCQYVRGQAASGCDVRFWTSDRFGETAVTAMDAAITSFTERHGNRDIVLIGYSGGGAVAALIAVRRDDVVALVTVAGTLDHRAWTEHHGANGLAGSSNPIEHAAALGQIRQIHFSGADDEIVPSKVAQSYMAALHDPQDARLIVLDGHDHTCCWTEAWPRLLAEWLDEISSRDLPRRRSAP